MLPSPIKITGDILTATEWNSPTQEAQNIVTDTGQILAGGDSFQLSKSAAVYTAAGSFYADTGAANAYTLSSIGSLQAPTAYINGLEIRFVPANTNTGGSTVNVAGLGVKDIKSQTGDALQGGQFRAGFAITLHFDTANDEFRLVNRDVPMGGQAGQLQITATLTDATIQPIVVRDSTNTLDIILSSVFVKQLNNTFVAGSGNGGRATGVALTTGTPYNVFVVVNALTGLVDVGFDTSITATNLLASGAGFTHFRRVWTIHTELSPATTNIQPFVQSGNRCYFDNAVFVGDATTGLIVGSTQANLTVMGATNLAGLVGIFRISALAITIGGGANLIFSLGGSGIPIGEYLMGITVLPSFPLIFQAAVHIPIGLFVGVPTMLIRFENTGGGNFNTAWSVTQLGWVDNVR